MKYNNFFVKLASFMLTGYFVSMGYYGYAVLCFMLYLGELGQSIADVIENKEL